MKEQDQPAPPTLSRSAKLELARQAEYLSVPDCALLLSVSPATIRRRLPTLRRTPYAILKHGQVLRIKRLALLALFAR